MAVDTLIKTELELNTEVDFEFRLNTCGWRSFMSVCLSVGSADTQAVSLQMFNVNIVEQKFTYNFLANCAAGVLTALFKVSLTHDSFVFYVNTSC